MFLFFSLMVNNPHLKTHVFTVTTLLYIKLLCSTFCNQDSYHFIQLCSTALKCCTDTANKSAIKSIVFSMEFGIKTLHEEQAQKSLLVQWKVHYLTLQHGCTAYNTLLLELIHKRREEKKAGKKWFISTHYERFCLTVSAEHHIQLDMMLNKWESCTWCRKFPVT